jgi:hypothetical protein
MRQCRFQPPSVLGRCTKTYPHLAEDIVGELGRLAIAACEEVWIPVVGGNEKPRPSPTRRFWNWIRAERDEVG